MLRRLALTTVAALLTVALSGCIYVGGTRHYHDDDYYDRYNGDRYDRYDSDRYKDGTERDSRYNDRHDPTFYQDQYRDRLTR